MRPAASWPVRSPTVPVAVPICANARNRELCMRFDRALILCLLLPLAGCITTHTSSNSLGKPLPQESKADQARDAARVHTELGQHYLVSGDLQTALAKLQMALQFDPNYAPAHTVIAYIYERIG